MNAKNTKAVLAIGLVVLGISFFIVLLNPLQTVQWKITDLFFKGRKPSDLITIIAIDEKSLNPASNLGRFKDWPRSYYAQLLRTIIPLKPAVIALDMDFSNASRGVSEFRLKQLLREYERKNAGESEMANRANLNWYGLLKDFETGGNNDDGRLTHPDDVDLQRAILEAPSVVLVSTLAFAEKIEEFSGKLPRRSGIAEPIFSGANAKIGFVNMIRDRDGILRRFIPRVSEAVSFPLAVAQSFFEAAGNNNLGGINNAGNEEQTRINYVAKPFSFRMISFSDALNGQIDSADIEGKIVFIGATARVLQDFQPTPTSRVFMPGVEVLANITQQFLDGKSLNEQGRFSLIFILILFAVGGSVILLKIPLRLFVVVFVLVLVGFPALAYGFYQTGLVLNVVYPETAWIFVGLAALWYRNKTELKAKKEIKKAFSHYVSPVVVEELAKNPANIALGGKRKQISVLFSDIVGFTSLAEKLTPEDTVALLNDYLTAMTEMIFSHNGTLDKYQGDAIMALFGAPLDDEHHAVNACHAALGMRRALAGLHEKWHRISELPFKEELVKLDFRVGIATGAAVVGNVGSEKRFDYTAIGDIVNLGSRLEGVNKKYGTKIIVDKATFETVTSNHNPFTFRKLDVVRVKGKVFETEIFELMALLENTTSDMKSMLDDFENGRIMYAQKNFADAKQYFELTLSKMPNDEPSQIYRNRCNFYLRKPPGRDWSPVVGLDEK